jgi:hypothetical protein
MSGMAVGATGNPDLLEEASKGERARGAHHGEDRAQLQVLRQRRVQAEYREYQDLRDDRDPVADDYVGDGLDERHDTRLLHAVIPSSMRAVVIDEVRSTDYLCRHCLYPNTRRDERGSQHAALAVAAAHAHGLPLPATLHLYLMNMATALTGAAQRLVPLGQTEAQRVWPGCRSPALALQPRH